METGIIGLTGAIVPSRANPKPLNGGKDCTGSSTNIMSCTQPVCIIDGGWTSWASSACSVTCGEGTLTKTRTCTNPAPQNGGKACAGNDTVIDKCSHVCPVDGNWGSWTSWGTCTVTCGSGEEIRTRKCDNPAPVGTGAHCAGPPADVRHCVPRDCPIDIVYCLSKSMINCNGRDGRDRRVVDEKAGEKGHFQAIQLITSHS
ncbi:hypothetical protein CHS0354_001544 [Potamilus streckersoni]|uniref:Uncharacterized protein n=1 Tax=Potamilus streckersoni TaxID=2493646 RepID=A0AAE0VZF6_9BIVA|nr:hypothetical protein CHS0354_001544 [Potamilus streckersoni]